MDDLRLVKRQMCIYIFLLVSFFSSLLVLIYALVITYFSLPSDIVLLIVLGSGLLISLLVAIAIANYVIEPLQALWQSILHISSVTNDQIPTPNLNDLRLGKDLVINLSGQIYQLVGNAENVHSITEQNNKYILHNFIATNLPLPLFVLDNKQTIIFANNAAAKYLGCETVDLINKNVYSVLDLLFSSDNTFDNWLQSARENSATSTNSWERVRLNLNNNHATLFFDLAAYYNKNNTDNFESLLVLFDHTKQYSQDDQAISFMALSVHELRTPLALLRGYIEVFDEEFSNLTDPQLISFMEKMKATAQQLTAFVNNILNVARIDDNQLELKLQKEDWPMVLKNAVDFVSLRAKVRGIEIKYQASANIPPVGVDRLSIQEVISNLIDNAVKYSGKSKIIEITTELNKEGFVETSVKDFGVGISSSVLPNLFTKFYRDHRNRAQIGGTGLGLYLSKAIISAHGGNIWVRSKEGQGSTFSFTVLPYDQLGKEIQSSNSAIVNGAHGWIKNHSLYRR